MEKSTNDQNNTKRRLRIQLTRSTLKTLANAQLQNVRGGIWQDSFNPCD